MGRTLGLFAASILMVLAAAIPSDVSRARGHASEPPFDQAAFDAAQTAGKPILIHITADWCSVCTRQKAILEPLLADSRFNSYVVFNVDFDRQKDLVRKFRAWAQSTFIVFKGTRQEAISSGDTRPKAIELLLMKGLQG